MNYVILNAAMAAMYDCEWKHSWEIMIKRDLAVLRLHQCRCLLSKHDQ